MGLIGGIARTAVVAGTFTAVSNRVFASPGPTMGGKGPVRVSARSRTHPAVRAARRSTHRPAVRTAPVVSGKRCRRAHQDRAAPRAGRAD